MVYGEIWCDYKIASDRDEIILLYIFDSLTKKMRKFDRRGLKSFNK